MLQQEGSLGSGHYVLEDESVRRVPDGAFHGGRPDSLSREQGMQDAGNGSHSGSHCVRQLAVQRL